MPRRIILTERQRNGLLALPSDEAEMLQHHVLSDDDIKRIKRKMLVTNQLGFALQLCAFRYPGRYLSKEDIIPAAMIEFISAQIGLTEEDIKEFEYDSVTRYEHLKSLQRFYGFKNFSSCESEFTIWLEETAIECRNSLQLAELFVRECRNRQIIAPGMSVIERLCADAKVVADRKIVERIYAGLNSHMKKNLSAMLDETVDGRLTVYAWLKRFEIGHNSADANRLLERLEYLQELDVPASVLDGIPKSRVVWLLQQADAYYADGLRDLKDERRYAILAVAAIEWKSQITDTILDTHDRIVGKLYNECTRMRDTQLLDQKKLLKTTLKAFAQLSKKLLQAHDSQQTISDIIQDKGELETLMINANSLTKRMAADPLESAALMGYGKFRRYTVRMLEDIEFQGNQSAKPVLEAITYLKEMNHCKDHGRDSDKLPTQFSSAKWHKILGSKPDVKFWETAVLFTIRDALRSRDIWVSGSRKYQDTRNQLLPVSQARECFSLPIPLHAGEWIAERKNMLDQQMKAVNRMIRNGTLPNSVIENGKIHVKRLERKIPEGADQLTLDVYREMPQVSITDIIQEVDEDTGFSEAFTHINTGAPCKDNLGLLNVLLAEGINLGLKKMALCSSSHASFWSLMRISQWHVNSDTSENALAILMDAHQLQPFAVHWGDGTTSSSDGQFMTAGGTGEAMNVVNAKHGNTSGLKNYTHVSDKFGLYAMRVIPSTVHEAPYILDGLTMNDTGRRIKEHYADTGGFTDHVFAVSALLGYEFAPRLRNLTNLRLYGMAGVSAPKLLKELMTLKASLSRIEKQWPDIIRLIASIVTHKVIPSEILRQLASFPRQNELAYALKEIGKIERTIFILKWISSTELQRRAQIGLNKGEAHHALKRALNFNRRGEIRDRFTENQHLRMMNLNLLAAIIIYWNTKQLGIITERMKLEGKMITPELLKHISPLGWEHIIITGFYKW
jgi:TnpA family transposase